MKTKLLRISVLFMMLFFFSCTGEDGATGAPGADGNANVVGSNPFTVSSWIVNPSGIGWSATVSAPQITQAMLDKGHIVVYFQNGSSWSVLPVTIVNSTSTNMLIDYSFSLGNIKIEVESADALATTKPGSLVFRAVFISATSKLANSKLNFKNYIEVEKALNNEN